MSRVLFVDIDESRVIAACRDEKVGISAIERLPQGGVRFVCKSVEGAERMMRKLKKHLISGEVTRERFRPASPLW